MSNWINNLKMALEGKTVILLHGNVRDRYIDDEGRVYNNLTELLTEVARNSRPSLHSSQAGFAEMSFYDPTYEVSGREKRIQLEKDSSSANLSRRTDSTSASSRPRATDDLRAYLNRTWI